MTDVVAVGCGTLLVDLKDDAVVIHGLGGGGDDLGVFRGKAGPGGNEKGDVVVEFYVHGLWLMGDRNRGFRFYHEGHEGNEG